MTHQSRTRYAMIAFLLLAIGCGSATRQEATAAAPEASSTAAAPAGATGSAVITGTVSFAGTPPAPAKIAMDADPVCQMQHGAHAQAEDISVANGLLKNVLVYVKEGLGSATFPAPSTPARLNQQGCWYEPHVLALQTGQPFEVVNSDGTLHNVNAKPLVNQPFNVAQPVQGMKTTKKFDKPEIGIKIKCNVHPWMHAYVHVLAHPFFGITGADGVFTLKGLPAGTYTLEAWHEQLGNATQTVTVGAGETKSVTFTFKGK